MAKMFQTQFEGTQPSEKHREVYGRYQILYTFNDFLAAIYFVIGSFLFLSASTQTVATWLFILGSFHFMLRPTIKLTREFHLTRLPIS